MTLNCRLLSYFKANFLGLPCFGLPRLTVVSSIIVEEAFPDFRTQFSRNQYPDHGVPESVFPVSILPYSIFKLSSEFFSDHEKKRNKLSSKADLMTAFGSEKNKGEENLN